MGSAYSTYLRDWKWSRAEKTIARRAFDLALNRELEKTIRETKQRAARIGEPSELWDLEHWLGERRRWIDSTFDFRYSVLPLVFTALLHTGRLHEDDLSGLDEDKLDHIRRMAR
jgi:hypothetical protein